MNGKPINLFTRYTASMGKLVNYWRENLSEFIDLWEAIHGTRNPAEYVEYRRCPLRFVSGRWGSLHSTELFILQRQRSFLEPVLLAMLSKRMKTAEPRPKGRPKTKAKAEPKSAATKVTQAEALLDDDSREAWNIKMSKWAAGAFSAVVSSQFWLCLRISQTVRGPLTHFFCWAQKHGDGMLLQLVTHKANEILSEYRSLMASISSGSGGSEEEGWFQAAVREANAMDLPTELLSWMQALAFKLLLSASANFYMRVVKQTERYPLKLLWMSFGLAQLVF